MEGEGEGGGEGSGVGDQDLNGDGDGVVSTYVCARVRVCVLFFSSVYVCACVRVRAYALDVISLRSWVLQGLDSGSVGVLWGSVGVGRGWQVSEGVLYGFARGRKG